MSDALVAQVAKTVEHVAQPPLPATPTYVVDSNSVGWLAGALLAFVLGFIVIMKRMGRDGNVLSAEGNLYRNLSERIETLTADLNKVVAERDDFFRQSVKLESRIEALERHERENIELRARLDEKNRLIEDLTVANDALSKRIEKLEATVNTVAPDCNACILKGSTQHLPPLTEQES